MRPRFLSTVAVAVAVGVASPAAPAADAQASHHLTQAAQTGHSADCVCRAQGRTFAVGESACLRTATGPRLAQCGMVLNNTSWQFTERPCPES
jgi:hypothetical protein